MAGSSLSVSLGLADTEPVSSSGVLSAIGMVWVGGSSGGGESKICGGVSGARASIFCGGICAVFGWPGSPGWALDEVENEGLSS